MTKLMKVILASLFLGILMVNGAVLPTSGVSVGDKTSGTYSLKGEFIDAQGNKHSAETSMDKSVEVVEVTNDYVVLYTITQADTVKVFGPAEGGWSESDFLIQNYKSTDYDTYDKNMSITKDDILPSTLAYEGYSDWSLNLLNLPTFDWVGEKTTDYLETYKNAYNDYFKLDDVPFNITYYDRDGNEKTLETTVSIKDGEVTLDGLKLSVKFTITGFAESNGKFYKGIDKKPVVHDVTYEGYVEYSDNGLIKSYEITEVYDAGSTGKYTLIESFGGGGIVSKVPVNVSWILLGMFTVTATAFLARKRK